MKRDGNAARDWRILAFVVLILVILIFIANLHLEVRGEVGEVLIIQRFIHSTLISFTLISGALFIGTIALSHRQARVVEQGLGMFFATAFGAFTFGLMVDSGFTVPDVAADVWSQFSIGTMRILIVEGAAWISLGISFGLLLALVTGREAEPDPLLELSSTVFGSEEE